ncbi:Electron transport complex protein RnfC [Olavius sp. associated proteobacterium Delta 1]|nr:Electron transport complex protein RnfC [Olavius sp. associated proteobacterium Delta 1]
MLKKSFFGLVIPQFEYERLPAILPEAEKVAASKTISLFHEKNSDQNPPTSIQIGDEVNTGQKISLFADDPTYVIASASGTVSAISPHTADFGKTYAAITIDIAETETFDDQFKTHTQSPTLENALEYLASAPGCPPLQTLADSEKPIKAIVISGVDSDLLTGTRQYITSTQLNDIKDGIQILKNITDIDRFILVTGRDTIQGYGHIGADVKSIDTTYPAALPPMIMKNVLGEIIPAGKTCEEMGVCFMSAEAVASIGRAYTGGQLPVHKILTLITKDGNQRLIETTIGTPIKDILSAYGVVINEEDRIVFGGPMTGSAVYSLDQPVLPDTDAILVLDRAQAAYSSDYPCINCGDCVRTCPAQIAVNMLVRFLEAGQYEEAADNYDLNSCIDCGLCSYVCVSKIPIFQYIRLAKYELDRAKTAEATDV